MIHIVATTAEEGSNLDRFRKSLSCDDFAGKENPMNRRNMCLVSFKLSRCSSSLCGLSFILLCEHPKLRSKFLTLVSFLKDDTHLYIVLVLKAVPVHSLSR